MAEAQISLVGPSYESRSLPLSAQSTVNLYPEPVPNGLSPSALLCWPGAKLFAEGEGVNRGLYDWRGFIYAVNGTKLYSISSTGSKTELGNIPGGARCVFAADAFYLYIVTGGSVYRTDGATVSEVTDSDLESPNSVAFINNQFVYDGDQGRFTISEPGDGGNIDALNYATAEALYDDLIRVYTFNQQIYMMGAKSIEPWYNSGVGTPPLDRIDGGLSHVGIAGIHAVTNTDKAVYFLGHDRTCYRLNGYLPEQISTIAINNAIEGYADVSDCFCFALKLQGQSFVIYSFPSADKTWCYSESINYWFELSTGVDGGRHLVNSYCYAFGKHLISDYRNGNVYEWDVETYSDNGAEQPRERVTQPIYSDFISAPGKTVFWNSIRLVMNSGNGLVLGQGVQPQVMMQFSDDGGRTWSTEDWRTSGKMGVYKWEVEWVSLGAAESRIYRFRVTDPVECHFYKLFADIEVGI